MPATGHDEADSYKNKMKEPKNQRKADYMKGGQGEMKRILSIVLVLVLGLMVWDRRSYLRKS